MRLHKLVLNVETRNSYHYSQQRPRAMQEHIFEKEENQKGVPNGSSRFPKSRILML